MDQTQRTVEVVGFKLANWEMDGKRGVSAEIYRRVPLDSRKNGPDRVLKGFATGAVRVPAELLERVKHLEPPFLVELTEEEVSNGKTMQSVVVDLRPVKLGAPAASKPAAPSAS